MYEHCLYGKCDALWLCAGHGAPHELKKLLEHSRPFKEDIDRLYGESDTNAMAQAFSHVKNEYKMTNIKLLLEYGADPNFSLYKGLTPLHMVIHNFFDEGVSLEDTEILVLALLRSESFNVKVKFGRDKKSAYEIVEKKAPTLKCLLQLGHIADKDVNDHVIRLLDRG